MSKDLTLKLHASDVKPGKELIADQYLITNISAYFNVVVSVLDANGDFLYFQGWDNGEYETFTPDMYQYWAELPARLP